MAYPPPVPPVTRTDATPMVTNHPGDHNMISTALTEILNHQAETEAKTVPTLWVNLTLTYSGGVGWKQRVGCMVPSYRRTGDMVQLRGVSDYFVGAGPVPMCTLPSGYRPALTSVFNTNYFRLATGDIIPLIVEVRTNGDLYVQGISGGGGYFGLNVAFGI